MARPAKESRENFEAGKVDGFSAGGHGHRVRVYAESGKLWIRYRQPNGKRAPRRLFPADTRALREKAAAVAVLKAEQMRSGERAQVERVEKSAEDLTIFDVAMLYMQRAPGFPAEAFDPKGEGVKAVVERWYAALPEGVRKDKTVPKARSLWTDVYAFLRMFRDPRFARGRKVMSLDPADGTNYAKERAAKGGSPRTPVNDVDRLSCAIRYVMTQYRRTYGIPYNPLEGRILDRSRAEVPEYAQAELGKLMAALERGEPGADQWQIRVVVGVAHSGRRIGAILELTAGDHDLEANTVTWRAEHAKGEAYGRGDEVMPMTPQHRTALEWALANRPNPNGPDAPLVWKRSEPSEHMGESAIDRQLHRLEKAAGVAHLPRRAFHGFCRSVITAVADAHGDGVAAEFAGRTPETIRRYSYKKIQSETMQKAAETIGRKATRKGGK